MLTKASIQNTVSSAGIPYPYVDTLEEAINCPECNKEFETKDQMLKHKEQMHEKAKEEKQMTENKPVLETVKVDYAAELSKVQEELAMVKLEQANKELEMAKKQIETATPKPVSTANVQQKSNAFEGYITAKDEDGLYLSKSLPTSTRF